MQLRIIPYLLLLYLIGHQQHTLAQQAPNSEWLGLSVPVSLSSKWQLTNEAGYRVFTSDYLRFQNFLRLHIRYHFNEWNNLVSGFALFSTKLSLNEQEKDFGTEYRLFEEGNHTIEISNKIKLLQRLRLEQRFFEATSKYESHLAHRFRLLVSMQYRLLPKWYLNLGSEYLEGLEYKHFKLDQWRMISFFSFIPVQGFQINLGYYYIIRPVYQQNVFILTFFKSFGTNEPRQHH